MSYNFLKNRFLQYWCLLPVFLFYIGATAQNFNSKVEAAILIDDAKDDVLEITGTAKNKTEENFSLRYELSVITSGANRSKNTQSGRFALEPFQTKELSQTSVSIDPQASTIILLVLYDQDENVIGTARKAYNEQKKEDEKHSASFQKKNEGIDLIGMVTEDTKTKAGKDFYDFFYQKYNLSSNKTNKMIKIEEAISYGRTTRILVKVEDRVVHQFFARPRLDFLKEQAEIALRQVNRYLEYLENRNELDVKY